MSHIAGRTALYRLYDNSHDLLYVGISHNFGKRLGQHSTRQPWWDEVTDVRVEYFSSRGRALQAEAIAIDREQPRYNIVRPAVATLEMQFRHLAQLEPALCDLEDECFNRGAEAEHFDWIDAWYGNGGMKERLSKLVGSSRDPDGSRARAWEEWRAEYGSRYEGRVVWYSAAEMMESGPTFVNPPGDELYGSTAYDVVYQYLSTLLPDLTDYREIA